MTSAIEQTRDGSAPFGCWHHGGRPRADRGRRRTGHHLYGPRSRQGQRDVPRARQGTALARGPRGRVISKASSTPTGRPRRLAARPGR